MLLAIDASRAAGMQKTGVGWYCHHLLQHLKDVIPHDVRVILYTDQPLPVELHPWPRNWTERVLRWRPLPLWSQARLAWQVLRDRPDILFIPAHVIPELLVHRKRPQVSFSPPSCQERESRGKLGIPAFFHLETSGREGVGSRHTKLITTIHDIVFKQFPDSYTPRERWYANHATRLAVRHADRIIVPTQHVARELERCYGCALGKVTVIHHGVEARSKNLEVRNSNASHFSIPTSQFILYVGRLERKKNVVRMVEAFDAIAPRHPSARLVLAGSPGYGYAEVCAAIDRAVVRERIDTPGWVDRGTYDRLLASATAFLFPTLGEGFGLPIIEAMAAGVPVITSVGGVHEEVAGDAALLVSATDTVAIANAIDRLLCDDQLRTDLVTRGRQRAQEFRWERSARATWEVIKSVLSA